MSFHQGWVCGNGSRDDIAYLGRDLDLNLGPLFLFAFEDRGGVPREILQFVDGRVAGAARDPRGVWAPVDSISQTSVSTTVAVWGMRNGGGEVGGERRRGLLFICVADGRESYALSGERRTIGLLWIWPLTINIIISGFLCGDFPAWS
jgi:hypothetical protein